MLKINYQNKCNEIIEEIRNKKIRPSLLLHVCCAPCSSYVIEYLMEFFNITLFFYNPNITPENEYEFRLNELKRYIMERYKNELKIISLNYDVNEYFQAVSGFEHMPEGSERCFKCYSLRLEKTVIEAKKRGFEWFSTTLSVSPYKNSQKLCEIGENLELKFGVKYLLSDFKKRGGYLRSVELSKIYGLYRQNYCGCFFSKNESAQKGCESN